MNGGRRVVALYDNDDNYWMDESGTVMLSFDPASGVVVASRQLDFVLYVYAVCQAGGRGVKENGGDDDYEDSDVLVFTNDSEENYDDIWMVAYNSRLELVRKCESESFCMIAGNGTFVFGLEHEHDEADLDERDGTSDSDAESKDGNEQACYLTNHQ